MERFKSFFKTSLIGGIVVILPAAIFVFVFKWLFGWVTDIIQPLTDLVLTRSHIKEIAADAIVLTIIVIGCFIIGVVVKTKFVRFVHENLENRILKIAHWYGTIKEIVMQLIGKKFPFSSVALVRIFENDTLLTAFITDSHSDGSYTIFAPTAPNPTSGFIYHVKGEYVHHVDVTVEEAMRSVITCGAGSKKLIKAYNERLKACDIDRG
ncbi:MAG: hypothetical protein QG578_624 [Thermodesulfobacteriota bacterium]|nr:hypothetical protein [Thermodesulfobacteriota bacterium]